MRQQSWLPASSAREGELGAETGSKSRSELGPESETRQTQPSDHTANPRNLGQALTSSFLHNSSSQWWSWTWTQPAELHNSGVQAPTHTSGGKCPMPWYFMGIWVLTDNSSVSSYTRSKNLPLWADSILQLLELVTDNTSMKRRRKLPLHGLCNCLRWEYWGSRASQPERVHTYTSLILFLSASSKMESPSILPAETEPDLNPIHISSSMTLYCHIYKQNLEQGPGPKVSSSKGNLSVGFKIRFFPCLLLLLYLYLFLIFFFFLFPCIHCCKVALVPQKEWRAVLCQKTELCNNYGAFVDIRSSGSDFLRLTVFWPPSKNRLSGSSRLLHNNCSTQWPMLSKCVSLENTHPSLLDLELFQKLQSHLRIAATETSAPPCLRS